MSEYDAEHLTDIENYLGEISNSLKKILSLLEEPSKVKSCCSDGIPLPIHPKQEH